MNEITEVQLQRLTLTDHVPLSNNPAAVYLAGLASAESRRTARAGLGVLTDLLMPGQFTEPGKGASRQDWEIYRNRCLQVNWGGLRFQHTAALRARLTEYKYERKGELKKISYKTVN